MSSLPAWYQHRINHAVVYSVFLPPGPAPLDGLLELQYSPPTPRPTGTAAQLERYFHHPSAITPPCSMSNQQPVGSPWNPPAGKTPYYGAPSNAPAGGHPNTAPGAAYNHAGAGTTAPAAFTLTPPPQGDPTIAQSRSLYAHAHAGAPTMVAHFQLRRSRRLPRHFGPPMLHLRSGPPMPLLRSELPMLLPGSGPPMPLLLRPNLPMPLPRSGPPIPLLRLAPLIYLRPHRLRPLSAWRRLRTSSARDCPRPYSWGPGTHGTPRQCPPCRTRVRLSAPTAQTPLYPHRRPLALINTKIPPPRPPRAALPYPAHATAPLTPPLAPYPTRLPTQRRNSPPPPPPRPTTPTSRLGTIDLSADVPPPPPQR